MYFIAPLLPSLFLRMFRTRWWRGRHLGSQVFADKSALRPLEQLPCRAIELYHRLCGSWLCWKEGGWKQYSAILIALAWGRWIDTSDCYINCRYDHFVNHACCNPRSARPQPENPRIWGCLEKPNGDGGLYTCNVTTIFDNNTAAGWVKAAMKLNNPTLFCC